MRRLLPLLLLAAAACGDPAPAPVPAPAAAPDPSAAAPATDAPFEATFGDPQLYERVWDAAASGKFDDLASLTLPLRCDRVRVAVRVLHDHLLGLRPSPPDRAHLLSALEALARAQGGASAKSLGGIVAAWRGWDETQVTAERELARRYAAGLQLLQAPKLDGAALASAIAGSGAPSPKSPAAADLTFLRGVVLLASAPETGAVPPDVADAWEHAKQTFEDLGWPGGFGSLGEHVAKRLLRENPSSFVGQNLLALAQNAYDASGDEVRGALTFLVLSDAAERRGDIRAAEYSAEGARRRFQQSKARGREVVDVFERHGKLCQMLGRQFDAARDLGRAWDESRWAHMDAPTRAVIAERLGTSLVILGRYEEAYAATREAAQALDESDSAGPASELSLRAPLDEISAEAALQLGRPAEAQALLTSAALRHATRSADPGDEWRRRADADLLMAARARVKAGEAAGAAKDVAAVVAREGVGAAAHAHASSIYRDAGLLDDAERELARAEQEGGDEFAAALTEERARLAAARRDWSGARELFRKAVKRVTPDDPAATVGWEAARVLLDWARMERDLGRIFEASELAGRAVVELKGSGLEMELDRARELYVSLQRRRNMWIDAAKVTEQRLAAGKVGDAARRENALLDLLLIRIEQLLAGAKDGEAAAREVVAQFEEGWRREVANLAVAAVVGGKATLPEIPDGASDRWRLLRDVAAATAGGQPSLELAQRCGVAEPELRRWAAMHAVGPGNHAIELRRHAGPPDWGSVVTRDDEAVLLVEPLGRDTWVEVIRRGPSVGHLVQGDAGLAGFWDATWVQPPKLAEAARRVSDTLFDAKSREFLAGVKRLWISLPEPLGPLPFDLLPYGDGTLLDSFEVLTVNSLAELDVARARTDPPLLTELVSPYATLESRHALVRVGMPDPAARTRLFELIGKAQNKGLDACAALREAKLALRAETKADAKSVPAWAAYVLRGAR